MRETKAQKAEREEAIASLREILPPGTTIYTALRHVSRSGMQREISLHIVEDGGIRWISGYAARAMGARLGKRDGIIAGGCGMDMGFHLVNNLSYALYPDGISCVGDKCPANDHSNGDRDYTPGHPHSKGSAGYAFFHRWI